MNEEEQAGEGWAGEEEEKEEKEEDLHHMLGSCGYYCKFAFNHLSNAMSKILTGPC